MSAFTDYTPEELEFLIEHMDKLPRHEQSELRKMIEQLETRNAQRLAQTNFLEFMRTVEPSMLQGPQHRIIGRLFERIAAGELKRLIINIAPRHSKSTISSYLLPAWFIGQFPQKKVIMASHTGDLAVDFGRKVRNLIASPVYRSVFPTVELAQDSKAAGRWNTNAKGEYYALGVGAAMAGRGGDLVIIDDPHSEQEAKSGNPEIFDSAFEWYQSGPRQRLQPGGAIVILMTRWNKRDLTGRVVDQMLTSPDGDKWEVVQLPAILPSGQPLWPEFWPLEELMRTKASMDERYWQAQYMQDPVSEAGAAIKREWWKKWIKEKPPICEFTIMTLDAAAETNTRADHTAIGVFGIFNHPDETGKDVPNIILIECIRERMEFPELKDRAYKMYKEWKPDYFMVEKKSSGTPLYQEMRRSGIPVHEFTPHRGSGDKLARLNSVADIVRKGLVWYPAGLHWAEEFVDEVAGFPSYGSDDRVDVLIMALMRFRMGGFIALPNDREYEDDAPFTATTRRYY